MPTPTTHSHSVRLLVLWYGIYQAGHVAVNLRGLSRMLRQQPLDFPAPAPPEGWSIQTPHFLVGIASIDLLGALLALAFVIGYFRRTRWWLGLGTIVLTISLYAAIVFNYGTWSAGAWTGENIWIYGVVNLLFVPVLVLTALVYRWSFAARSAIL